MAEFSIVLNDRQVQAALGELLHRVGDISPVMQEVAGIMEDATENAFSAEVDPTTGEVWDPLSDTTLALRPERAGGQILQDSGLLAASIVSDYGPDFAQVGTNKVQAPTHQFGAQQGEFGATSRGGPIPWGDIPARPFLGIGPADEEDILDVASRYLAASFD